MSSNLCITNILLVFCHLCASDDATLNPATSQVVKVRVDTLASSIRSLFGALVPFPKTLTFHLKNEPSRHCTLFYHFRRMGFTLASFGLMGSLSSALSRSARSDF